MALTGPSKTARGAAGYRAAHQAADGATIFRDPFARLILEPDALAEADERARDPASRNIRLFMAARSRFADDCLEAAVARCVRQVVVLGAGLDTLALRNPFREIGVKVYEVDQPLTQAWKRERLAAAKLRAPNELVWVPVDFETDDLSTSLATAGFRPDQSAIYVWLGVTPYLTRPAVFSLLEKVAQSPDAAIVFDYSEPIENYPPERRPAIAAMAERVAAAGEPWLTLLDPIDLRLTLEGMGYTSIEDLGPGDVAARYFGGDHAQSRGGAGPHLVLASTDRKLTEI
ncbi:class I SAM-dependent methyltransferase [Rhizobium oryzicola]|uniref:S-adenosyl-L-methionine-dependent methyltransferase n=1 Tax=Rhizobium oryzicola TaxID=1232668 RepID=A0ABT8SS73_9HYPH|nr:SAM-dependent methyltransferase [Rhizobium oryzicola]MDO1580878.1 SAM-dependent methyltransferase [Rhizobium oryzicola]